MKDLTTLHNLKRIVLVFCSLTALLSSPSIALALPVPNPAGDYVAPPRKILLHHIWKVVDPDPAGLRCRMPLQFHGKRLDDEIPGRLPGDRDFLIGDRLLKNDKWDIGSWEVFHILQTGTRIYAFGGNLGAMIIVRDRYGKPWLPVVVTSDGQPPTNKKAIGYCFVRANQRFIQPI